MAKKKKKGFSEKLGVLAYTVGFLLAILIALISPHGLAQSYAILFIILGIIVGLINITDQEVETYLIAAVSFIISAWALSATLTDWPYVKTFTTALIVFTAPGALVVSFKALYKVAKD